VFVGRWATYLSNYFLGDGIAARAQRTLSNDIHLSLCLGVVLVDINASLAQTVNGRSKAMSS
jgi:hypothetical protein